MRVHADERRTAYCDLFDTPGDVNLFVINPRQKTYWHRHSAQTDHFRVVKGTIILGFFWEETQRHYTTLTEDMAGFTVSPGHWHGYENPSDEPAYLLMYLDRPYDCEDESRREDVPWDPM